MSSLNYLTFKKEERVSQILGEGIIKIVRVERRGEKIAVLFQDQNQKNESWLFLSNYYFKNNKKGNNLDKEKFLRWGVFESPMWFGETAPGVPLSLIASELADNLQIRLNKLNFENGAP